MEQKSTSTILFPYDFSKESDSVLGYLSEFSKIYEFSVKFLNILDPGTKKFMLENHLSKAVIEQKISQMAFDFQSKNAVNSTYLIKNVPIKRIRKISINEEVTFTMLGIAEPKKYSTKIMKVVTTSPVPILVVQEGVTFSPYKNIVFPLDDAVDSRQKAGWALKIAKKSNATIHIFSISPAALKNKEKEYRQYKVIESVEKFFRKNQIKIHTEISQGGYKDYADDTMRYADKINADLFVIMIVPEKIMKPVNPVDFKLIFNPSKIPIMCVNQRDLFVGGGIT
ncbi:MAG: universal stress protein [Bacteroidota bacterium]